MAAMSQEIFLAMRQSIIDGAPEHAVALAQQALQSGIEPLDAINQGYVPGITHIGEQFGRHEVFLPDIMMAAEAMKKAVAVLEPEMQKRGLQRQTLGTIVLGTVKGDIHEIGKNLVGTLLSASGFRVFDLGTDVAAEKFARKAAEVEADVVGVSALLTTTMMRQKSVVEALRREGMGRVKVIVGGAPVTRNWATEIGADGYAPDALRALELVKSIISVTSNTVT